ncbi:MAG: single-stranded DNA-binding protein [Ruminococcus sp.]|nr:single-stranded DNA-binding protein [Ruminococcus sp.]
MLNKVILMGRITRDLELKTTPQGVSVLTFTVAVDRSFVKQGEERQADFITCVAWRNQAEFINHYFAKGRMIALVGNLRTRTYDDKNGTKHYVTEVYVDEVSFTGEPKQGGYAQASYNQQQSGYNQGYNSQGYSQQSAPSSQPNNYQSNKPQPDDPVNIGDFQDFDVFSDDGVPF